MKNVVVATVLAAASTFGVSHFAMAQAATDIQLPAAEANAYNSAASQGDPKAQAAALQSFLTQFPNTQVKALALEQLLQDYVQTDGSQVIPTADKLLQVDPNNLRALTMEAYVHTNNGQNSNDPAQKQSELDTAAGFAQKGLAALNAKPKGMSDDDFNKLKATAAPIFYSAVGADDLAKKDAAGAIDSYKKELAAVPEAQTTQSVPLIADTFQLAQAYVISGAQTPTDLVNCAFYAARASAFAPDQFKAPFLKTGQYCYNKYHGKMEGFEVVQQAAQASLNPPDTLKVTPAPKPADLVTEALKGADPATLALADREFALQYGTNVNAAGVKDADTVWAAMKGKSVTIPDAIVIAATGSQLQVAVSDDAQQTKTADVTVTIKPMEAPEAPKAKTAAANAAYKKAQTEYAAYQAATAVGGKVTFEATYDSFTTTPFMITMVNGEVQMPKAAAPAHAAPAHAAPAHHAAHK